MVMTDRPGKEVSKDYREVITHLIDNEGWDYRKPVGNGYPQLRPANSQASIRVLRTGHTKGRRFGNFVAEVRRNGGR
jgi:hypothetical protein